MSRLLTITTLVIVGASLLWPFEVSGHDRLQQVWWQFCHFPAFLLICWVVLRAKSGPSDNARLGLRIAMLLLAVPAIEALQALTGRTPSWGDVAMGWLGVAAGMSLCRARRFAVFLLLIVFAVMPVLGVVTDRAMMRRSFPVLASFQTPLEKGRWDGNACSFSLGSAFAHEGRYAMQVTLYDTKPYPGLFMTDVVGDWSDAEWLCLHVHLLGSTSLQGWVRIDDRPNPPYADRFQHAVTLEPGDNIIRIEAGPDILTPDGRRMDRSAIFTWGLFFDSNAAGRQLFIDTAHLILTPPLEWQ